MGLGFMLTNQDTEKLMDYEKIYNEILDMELEDELTISWVSSDCYCGDWLFIGVSRYGSEDSIERVPYGDTPYLFSNGDDIDLELKAVLGADHPFFKYAKFGFYFGTDFT